MMLAEDYEVIDGEVLPLDPVLTGFSGVVRELVFDGEGYVCHETALGSGESVFSFRSAHERRARAVFEHGPEGVDRAEPVARG